MRYYNKNFGFRYCHQYFPLEQLASFPYNFLAHDLLYFITHANRLQWEPIKMEYYERVPPPDELLPYNPHPLSLFSIYMEIATRRIMIHSVLDYKKIYDFIVGDEQEHKLERFVDYCHEYMMKLYTGDILPHPEEIFHRLVHLGRLAAEFYKQGTKDAPYLAGYIIEQILINLQFYLNSRVFFFNLDRAAYDINYFFDYIYDGRGYTEMVYDHNPALEKDDTTSDPQSDERRNRNQSSVDSKRVGPGFLRARYRPGFSKVHRIARMWR